ncbi:MAG TPA: hypothetical protein VK172_05585 [Lentimicrobium sp.]|jgi:hypothetical protein|nr:hypothetical protein [Lentimicrobium sp.]
MKNKLLKISTLGVLFFGIIATFTFISQKSISNPPTAVYYYRVTITNEAGIPANASGSVRVSDDNGNIWSVPYVHGTSAYNIPSEWISGHSVVACPSLSLNVSVNMMPSVCKSFSNPLNYCIGNLQLCVGGVEN